MSALIFHHGDFAFQLDKELDGERLRRVDSCAIQVQLDTMIDDKYPWMFRGLSVEAVNHVLNVLSRMRNRSYNDLSEKALKEFFTPYDAMPFQTKTEKDLFVAYSIKDPLHPFRQLLIGPESVSLYEKDIPHFGPIYVFRARLEYNDDENVKFHMLDIESSVDEILSVLETLNFGG